MFGRAKSRRIIRRGKKAQNADQAFALRRLERLAPKSLPDDQAIGDHASGWVPRGRSRRTPSVDDDPEPDGLPREGPSPSVRLATRFGVTPTHIAVVSIGLVLAVVLAGVAVVRGRPHSADVPVTAAVTAPGQPAVAGAPTAKAAATSATPAVLVVHVVGKVRRPGVVRVPPGSRVTDAIAAAGGSTKGTDLGALNLARLVADGEQIAVGVPTGSSGSGGSGTGSGTTGNTGSGTSGSGPSGTSPNDVIDLNAADLAALDTLPGVGPVLAQRILDFRTQNGRFTSVDELREVKGIGVKTFADIEPHVRV